MTTLYHTKVTPADLGLGEWRPYQQQAIREIVDGKHRFLGMCAPTGFGKSATLIGAAVDSGARTLVLTSSKALQAQYMREFGNLNLLDIKGKSNYLCNAQMLGGEFYTGAVAGTVDVAPCQYGEECGLKEYGCQYYDRRNMAKYKKFVSTNYAAWISANLYGDGWGKFDLICCDEGHDIENWLSRMLAVKLPHCHVNLIGTKYPNTTNVAIWVRWAKDQLPVVRQGIRAEKKAIKQRRKRLAKLHTLQSIENSLIRLSCMTHEWKIFPNESYILFQPIWVHDYAESLLFNHADKVVFASSTIVPNTLNLLGITDNDMDFFSYPSIFPVERRPIYYYPVVRVHHKMSEEEKQLCISVMDNFISRRLDRKGFISTSSFAWQNTILKYSKFASLMVASSPSSVMGNSTSSASMTLERFKKSRPPSILIGPNFGTGIDLKGELAEYTIIPKVPFADITDPLHMARSEDNPDYGWFDAGLRLTQTIGRAMRDVNDSNETLILDKQFGKYLSCHQSYIPDWVHSAIHTVRELPAPRPKL